MVALDPAANLAFEIALRLAQIGEADCVVIEAVKEREIIEKRFADTSCCLGRKVYVGRNILAKNDAMNGVHQIKRSAEHGEVVTKEKHMRGWRVVGMKF
jgi:hypothetical protein